MAVFPSRYIHVGGDECPKDYWKRSDYCQQLIQQNKLKDEHGLQSYFIQRIEKYINGKGRSIIGWDEILEGGLAPNATVMSWRGTAGGIEAAKQGHDVIMSPVDQCYLNLYQSDDASDSIAWGGMLPLKTVYNYEPIPSQLSSAEAVHVIGLQGNLWTEYINSPALAEFMLFPRAIALAESGWRKSKTGFDDFTNRLVHFMARWDAEDVNYSKHVYDIRLKGSYLSNKKKMQVSLSGVPSSQPLFYSINGSNRKLYTQTFTIEGKSTVMAVALQGGKIVDKGSARFHVNLATGKPFSLAKPPAPQYVKGGTGAWINGVLGSDTRYTDEEWLGWNGDDFEGTIDFQNPEQIAKVIVRVFNNPNSWVYPPSSITVLASSDGLNFEELSKVETAASVGMGAQTFELKLKQGAFRFLKIKAVNHGLIGKGNPGAGYPAWLFLDEVVVE
jgi:hexosaminidase